MTWNKEEEKPLCEALRAFVEEFGSDEVIVKVPKSWVSYLNNNRLLHNVKVELQDKYAVSITVPKYNIVKEMLICEVS
jgi:hypothetical protein